MSDILCHSCDDLKVVSPVSADPLAGFDIRGLGEIKVNITDEVGKKIYNLSRQEFTAASISADANPIVEVGAIVSKLFTVVVTPGVEAITSRVLTPQTNPVTDVSGNFTLNVAAFTQSFRGFKLAHTFTVSDAIGVETERIFGMTFYNKVLQGYSIKDSIVAADTVGFTSTLANTILSQYGGVKSYAIPALASLQYIYWLYELGTTPISAVELSGLPFPVVNQGTISITNANGIAVNYSVVRSANKFGTTTLNLKIS